VPTVRYFAAAAEAAGRESEVLAGDTVGQLRSAMIALHGAELERVLTRCAVLVEGLRSDEGTDVAADAVVDVLPPFAGG
jgi:molybdopterin converting factor small subunit